MEKYDAIVVGAGPAGSMAALNLAKENLRVLLVDKKQAPGTPKECAEAIGKHVFELLKIELDQKWISNKYDSILMGVVNRGKIIFKTYRTQGYILNRKAFDYDLASRANTAGAEILFNTFVNDVSINDEVEITTTKGKFKSKLLIAADGPLSRIAQKMNLGRVKNYFGYQYELEGSHQLKQTLQIHFYPELNSDNMCWIFPKKETLNVGLASPNASALKSKLDRFIQATGLSGRKVLDINFGFIPGQNKLKKIFADKLLIVGDAAGHTNPLTGGGIPAALHDGILAGEIASKAIKLNKLNARFLSQYQSRWDRSPFNSAWLAGYKLKKALDNEIATGNLLNLFSKVGSEIITCREEAVEKIKRKKLNFWEIKLLYKMGTTLFNKVLDYAM